MCGFFVCVCLFFVRKNGNLCLLKGKSTYVSHHDQFTSHTIQPVKHLYNVCSDSGGVLSRKHNSSDATRIILVWASRIFNRKPVVQTDSMELAQLSTKEDLMKRCVSCSVRIDFVFLELHPYHCY